MNNEQILRLLFEDNVELQLAILKNLNQAFKQPDSNQSLIGDLLQFLKK